MFLKLRKMDGSMKKVKSKAKIEGVVASREPVFVFFWKPLCLLSKKIGKEFCDFYTKFPHGYFFLVCFLSFTCSKFL